MRDPKTNRWRLYADSPCSWRRRAYSETVGLKPYRFIPKDHRLDIPEDVLADRDRRKELSPESITAAQLGDPLPGYSALTKRQTVT